MKGKAAALRQRELNEKASMRDRGAAGRGPRGLSPGARRPLMIFYVSMGLLIAVGVMLLVYSVRAIAGGSSRGWHSRQRRAHGDGHEVVWIQRPSVGDLPSAGTGRASSGSGKHAAGGDNKEHQEGHDGSHPASDDGSSKTSTGVDAGLAPDAYVNAKHQLKHSGGKVDMSKLGVVVVVRSNIFPVRFVRRVAATAVTHVQFVFVAVDLLEPTSFTDGIKAVFSYDTNGGGGRGGAHEHVQLSSGESHSGGVKNAYHGHTPSDGEVQSDGQQDGGDKRTVAVGSAMGDDSSFTTVHPALRDAKLIRVAKDTGTELYPTYADLAMIGADEVDDDTGLLLFIDPVHVPTAPHFVDRLMTDFREEEAAAVPPAMKPAMMQCTIAAQADRGDQARDGLLVTVEQGFEVQVGSVRAQPSVFLSRRYAGINLRDDRLRRRERVVAVSPFCTIADRVRFFAVGGFVSDGPSGFDLAVSGKLNGHAIDDAVELLRARILRVEKTMESISLAEVHAAGNTLRQLVREAYAEVVDASSLWEDLTGVTFDSQISKRLSLQAAAADEKAMRSLAKDPVDVRLRTHTRNLVDEAARTRKIGQSRDAAQLEEQVGWDASLRLRTKGYSVFATNVTAVVSYDEMGDQIQSAISVKARGIPGSPVTSLRSEGASSNALAGSFPLSGAFHGRWANYARSLHPAFANLAEPVVRVVWFAVCCGCCGFSSEIVHFVVPLQSRYYVNLMPGPKCFCQGYPSAISDAIARMHITGEQYILQRATNDEVLVWISHTDPSAYNNDIFARRRPDYLVGRSMYEFSRIGSNWIESIGMMDELWVPAKWVKDLFAASGIPPWKMFVVPEAVDTDFYAPTAHTRIDLPLKGPLKEGWIHYCNRDAPDESRHAFTFFSNFKWEPRKGWDILFEAYELEFGSSSRAQAYRVDRGLPANLSDTDRPASLYILTYLFLLGGGNIHNVTAMVYDLEDFLEARFPEFGRDVSRLPHFCLITDTVSEVELAQLYNRMDAFVLPTRGEGWGLPAIQAMSMAKPVISPAWGGQSEFMTPDTTFIVDLEGIEEVPPDSLYGFQKGKKWATPSTNHTGELMRYVFDNPLHAARVGRRAREHVVKHFNEEAVADVVDARLQAIREKVVSSRRSRQPPPG